MICERCQQPIKQDEGYTTFTPDTASSVTPTVYLHRQNCVPVPHQSAPLDRAR